MRLATLLFVCTLPCLSQGTECSAALQIIEANGQLVVKNISDEPITAYRITKVRSRDRKQLGTYEGNFVDGDGLGPGQSLEIARANPAGSELSVDYVRLAGGWQCGETPLEGRPNEDDASPSR
jgi:hypothetical protein